MTFTQQEEVRLRDDLRALRAGKRLSWSRIGEMLDIVGSYGYWQAEGARSFSAWLRALAHSLGCRESSLWRYRSAARQYKRVSKEMRNWELPIPPPERLPDYVSPENIELLAKLARVAPQDLVHALAARIVRGEITRGELRRTWQIFRPALGSRTARGRGSQPPQINHGDPQQHESALEALIFNALVGSTGAWSGHEGIRLYKAFTCVQPEPLPASAADLNRFDTVVVLRAERDPLEIHGFQCEGTCWVPTCLHDELMRYADYCDYLWVIGEQGMEAIDSTKFPFGVGLAAVHGVQVHVIRPAAPTARPVRYREAMLNSLLTLSLEG